MESLQVSLRRAKETKNTIRYEEPQGDQTACDRHPVSAEVGRRTLAEPGDDHGYHRVGLICWAVSNS